MRSPHARPLPPLLTRTGGLGGVSGMRSGGSFSTVATAPSLGTLTVSVSPRLVIVTDVDHGS